MPPLSTKVRQTLGLVARSLAVPTMAVVLALLCGAVVIIASGSNPITAYVALARGAFGTPRAIGFTIERATPLIFNGLAVAFAFRAGLFNIGGQGQLLFGALASAVVGFSVHGLPAPVHITLAIVVGTLAGGLWGAVPGLLKAYTGAHEVITTIMLNYVAYNITDYLTKVPFRDTSPGNAITRTPEILDSARVQAIQIFDPTTGDLLFRLPLGIIFALLCAVVVWWVVWRTTFGFELSTVGLNQHAARYAGMQVQRTVVLAMIISGMLAGFGGSIETLGVFGRYQPGFNVGLGFEGITVALLGKTHPLGVIPAAFIIGTLQAGASTMQFDAGVAREITDVIQALLLFFVAADVIIRTLLRMRAAPGEKLSLSTGWGGS